MNRSPYAGEPKTRPSVVVCLDILGFQEQMKAACGNGTGDELLRRLHAALDKAYTSLQELAEGREEARFYDMKYFTDNLVIGHPLWKRLRGLTDEQQGESELGFLFDSLSDVQLVLALEGFFVRGAISCGDLYMDDKIVFGKGLLEAHDGEDKLARDPRIILMESAKTRVMEHLKFYINTEDAPQRGYLLKDADRQIFVNYLHAIEWLGDPHLYTLEQHASVVRKKLVEFESVPRIWSKYVWVAHYHNYYCELIGADELKIEPGCITANISRI